MGCSAPGPVARLPSPVYLTDSSRSDSVHHNQFPSSIGVLEAIAKPMPIGMAMNYGRAKRRLALEFAQRMRHASVGPPRLFHCPRMVGPTQTASNYLYAARSFHR